MADTQLPKRLSSRAVAAADERAYALVLAAVCAAPAARRRGSLCLAKGGAGSLLAVLARRLPNLTLKRFKKLTLAGVAGSKEIRMRATRRDAGDDQVRAFSGVPRGTLDCGALAATLRGATRCTPAAAAEFARELIDALHTWDGLIRGGGGAPARLGQSQAPRAAPAGAVAQQEGAAPAPAPAAAEAGGACSSQRMHPFSPHNALLAARAAAARAFVNTLEELAGSPQPLSAHQLLQLGVKRCGPGQLGSLPDPGQYTPLLSFMRGSDMIDGGRVVLPGDQVPARLRQQPNRKQLLRLYDKLLGAASEAYLHALRALVDDLEREPNNQRWAALALKIRARTDAAGGALGRLALTVIAGAGNEQIMHVDGDFIALLLALTDGPALLVDTGADKSPEAVEALIRDYDPDWQASHVTEPGAQQAHGCVHALVGVCQRRRHAPRRVRALPRPLQLQEAGQRRGGG